jgi:thiosulfate/3-mercaptopyruvate sulfurtransferase
MGEVCGGLPSPLPERVGKKEARRSVKKWVFSFQWKALQRGMRNRRAFLLFMAPWFTLLLLNPSALLAGPIPIKKLDTPRLIETGELAGFVDHPLVRIIDVRTSLSEYLKGHLPNAVYLNAENLGIPRKGVPAQAPDRICLERLLGENLGVSSDMWLVVYSEKSDPNATFLVWTLDFLGRRRVGVLNGGWEKWVSENHTTTQEYPALSPKKFFAKVIQEEVLADKKWVRGHLSTKEVVIVDARPLKRYSGEEGEEIRKGHIPGARNLFWQNTLEGNGIRTWKKREDLEKVLGPLGIVKDKVIVVYCTTGKESSHLYFTLRYVMGFPDVRLYRGGWVEWSADKSLPIKTGPEP